MNALMIFLRSPFVRSLILLGLERGVVAARRALQKKVVNNESKEIRKMYKRQAKRARKARLKAARANNRAGNDW